MNKSKSKRIAQHASYEITRLYVLDQKTVLGPELLAKILGWIRARSIGNLASCRQLLTDKNSSCELAKVLMQIEAFFKKNAAFSGTEEQKQEAIRTFEGTERKCSRSNRRLSFYYRYRDRLDPDIALYMKRAERWIDELMGPFQTFLEEIPALVRLTSGATASASRKRSRPHMKVKTLIECTPKLIPYADSLVKSWGFDNVRFKRVYANRLEFVSKNWKTYRTIACEPEGNLPFQLAFDAYSKRRLRRRGIDLSDQSRNREQARIGSINGLIATMDLTSASDLDSRSLVAWLFPKPWADFLDDVRSPMYIDPISKEKKVYHKFSSMGNGATFGVLTIVFAAAAYAVGSKQFSVYGDDLTIEVEFVEPLMRFLSFLGFTVNAEKSYSTGFFRESCGGNYWHGVDITPFYLREWSERKTVLCHNVNGLVSISTYYGNLWKHLYRLVSDYRLPFVPYSPDSLSGVWIPARESYSRGLLKSDRYTRIPGTKEFNLWYRGYTTKVAKSITLRSWKGLVLWYLSASQRREPKHHSLPSNFLECSRDTLLSKYRRKWVRWRTPAGETPAHLYWWAEFTSRVSY